jgi:hypothetical protein
MCSNAVAGCVIVFRGFFRIVFRPGAAGRLFHRSGIVAGAFICVFAGTSV